MTRFHNFTDRHPVISMFIGWLLLLVIGLVILPADPPGMERATYAQRSAT
jgi:hypothetical protein